MIIIIAISVCFSIIIVVVVLGGRVVTMALAEGRQWLNGD